MHVYAYELHAYGWNAWFYAQNKALWFKPSEIVKVGYENRQALSEINKLSLRLSLAALKSVE